MGASITPFFITLDFLFCGIIALGSKTKFKIFNLIFMANQVIKKDGSKEPFDAEKIKKGIRLASQQAGLDEAKQNEITEKVTAKVVEMLKDQEEVRAMEIRDKILGELDLYAPTVSAAWRDYEKSKKK